MFRYFFLSFSSCSFDIFSSSPPPPPQKKKRLQLQHTRILDKFSKCNKKLTDIANELEEGKRKMQATAAFVTFSDEAGFLLCKNAYPDLGFLYRLTYPKFKRMSEEGSCLTKFFGGTRIRVNAAPEPGEIIWENLDIHPASRFFRKVFTSTVTLAVLAASFLLIYQGQRAQVEADLKYPATDCSGYSVFPGSDPNATQQLYNFSLTDLDVLLQHDVEKDVNWNFYNSTFGNTGKLECFCKALGFSSEYLREYGIKKMYTYPFWNEATGQEETWCGDWFKTFSYILGLKYTAIGGVVVTNVLLRVRKRRYDKKREKRRRCLLFVSHLFLRFLLLIF